MVLALAPIPRASAASTIRLQAIKIKKNTAFIATRANKKRLHAERHWPPLHANDLRRLAAFVPDSENPDVIARRDIEMLEWKLHRPLKRASLSQCGHADFAAHVAGDRVRWFAVTHSLGLVQSQLNERGRQCDPPVN